MAIKKNGEDLVFIPPKERIDNEIYRVLMLKRGIENLLVRKRLIEESRKSILFWINSFVFQYNPKPKEGIPEITAFITYPFQDKTILEIEDAYNHSGDILIEKSREMGVTWLMLMWGLWHFLFDDHFQFLVASYDEEVVDNWELDSLFGKLAFMIKMMPIWILPKGYEREKHRTKLKITNPVNQNAIIGITGRKFNLARGGRYSAMLLDEFAFWERSELAWTSTRDAVKCRFPVSTPNGKLNKFYKIRESGVAKVLTLHWKDHPERDLEWYKKECEVREPWEIAQELDISYEGSVMNKVYPNFDIEVKIEKCEYNKVYPLYILWDFGEGGVDPTAMIWMQWDKKKDWYYIIDCYSSNYREIKFFAPFVNGIFPQGGGFKYTEEETGIIERHRYYGKAQHIGDPYNGEKVTAIGRKTIKTELQEEGINMNFPRRKTFDDRRRAALRIMKKLSIDPEKCEDVIMSLSQCRFPKIKENHESVGVAKSPVHDWTSHFRTAFEYGADFISDNPGFGNISAIRHKKMFSKDGFLSKILRV